MRLSSLLYIRIIIDIVFLLYFFNKVVLYSFAIQVKYDKQKTLAQRKVLGAAIFKISLF